MTIMTVYIDTDHVKQYPLDIDIKPNSYQRAADIHDAVVDLIGNSWVFEVYDDAGNLISSSEI